MPEIQRAFVWENRKVRELIDSIYRNYPIGALLVWNMQREFIEEYKDLLRPLTEDLETKKSNFQYMVIDGQQRLVSIYLVKHGSIKLSDEWRSLDLYFNVQGDEFHLARGKGLDKEPTCFKLSDILSRETLEEILEEKSNIIGDGKIVGNKILYRKLELLRNKILNYPVNLVEIPEHVLPYDKNRDNFQEILERISEIFVRLNSQGTRIKMPDLVIAILTARTRGEIGQSFKEHMREITKYFEGKGWDLDQAVLMRVYMAIATGATKFKEAKDRLRGKNANEILEELKTLKILLDKLTGVLEKQLNVKSLDYLKSKYSLVTLGMYLNIKQELETADITSIRRWLLLSSFDRRYTGRLEGDLDEDIKLLREKKSLRELENNLKVREITDSLLDTEFDQEHRLALIMLLKDAFDLRKGELISMTDIEPRKLHEHHIFPKDVLRKVYGREMVKRIDGEESRMDIEKAYNLVANMTIVSEEANEKIKNKRPDDYLQEIDSKILEQHCIPSRTELWKPENYLDFIEERKRMLLHSIEALL